VASPRVVCCRRRTATDVIDTDHVTIESRGTGRPG